MKSIYESNSYRVYKQNDDEYLVEDRSKVLFVGYNNGCYNLIKFFTKSELKIEFGIEV